MDASESADRARPRLPRADVSKLGVELVTLGNRAYRGVSSGSVPAYSTTLLNRRALVTTDTELIAIAAPAKIGESSRPNTG